MRFRILPVFAAFAALTLSSCYVVPDPPPEGQANQKEQTLSDAEQQKLAEQREKKKRDAEEAIKNKPSDPGDTASNPDATPKPPTQRANYPTAQPVPGKDGYVFSPYNQKIVDVREIPSGSLVRDPTYPEAEKKHFRVP